MSEQNQGLAANPSDWPKALFYVALLFSIFQIITAAFHPVSSQILRAVHVGSAMRREGWWSITESCPRVTGLPCAIWWTRCAAFRDFEGISQSCLADVLGEAETERS